MKWPAFLGISLVTMLLASSCASTPLAPTRSTKAQDRLNQALAGRVAGAPQRCISNFPSTEVRVIDDWTILYDEGSTVYLQTPQGGCNGLANRNRTLVARQVVSSQMCQGDINETVDLRTGISGGPCIFGPFVPYTRARI